MDWAWRLYHDIPVLSPRMAVQWRRVCPARGLIQMDDSHQVSLASKLRESFLLTHMDNSQPRHESHVKGDAVVGILEAGSLKPSSEFEQTLPIWTAPWTRHGNVWVNGCEGGAEGRAVPPAPPRPHTTPTLAVHTGIERSSFCCPPKVQGI
eukprot:scaffold74234_cov61-Attheya_sp.AAC.2